MQEVWSHSAEQYPRLARLFYGMVGRWTTSTTHKQHISDLTNLCGFVCMGVCMAMCVLLPAGKEVQPQVNPSCRGPVAVHLGFQDKVSLAWSSKSRLDLLSREAQAPSNLCLYPSTEIIGVLCWSRICFISHGI